VASPSGFSYQKAKSGEVFISWQGKPVVTLAGKRAAKLLDQLADAGDEQAQLVLARFTGNFKRGNERHSR